MRGGVRLFDVDHGSRNSNFGLTLAGQDLHSGSLDSAMLGVANIEQELPRPQQKNPCRSKRDRQILEGTQQSTTQSPHRMGLLDQKHCR
ncbi:unnamed protein product [Tuwongella immobilis]|uniref:Uncharacterized protein n=1 Tax=Tuwongella immobilis TaxID=692036 RepID=A0A6C2YID5_9BACT|nr:unnamed protein product [Tuwongella immobilis]VTR97088.1 unnamed protein product [Tuwongella immobilis]